MMVHVYDNIDAYNLWFNDLEHYLRSLFPGQNVEVTMFENQYRMKIPRRLAKKERRYICDRLRKEVYGF
ncbi:hypothetical protein QBC34DRAFT_416492 [Podospora aff. communis PSN243]|uniref:Uncharacterized protein n=1 Tax=Podospora aff. communis PSN243 TaxID=3040156 RepID=A0AAV9G9H3_9PEZI|nr:hypothetical protein QBC34DRAFT_416492 [Podospora aff. communis PSN243]